MIELIIMILITAVTAILSLSGGFLLLTDSKAAKIFQKYSTIFAAAVLLYAAFGDIIPEVLEDGELPVWQVALLVAIGIFSCFIIGALAGHFHRHGEHKDFQNKKQAYAMLIVDSLHTAMDGIVIGTSFASGLGTGILSAVATAAHEIPQEIGDFSIMVRSKMPRKSIIKLQVLSALILVPFSIIAYFVGDALSSVLPSLLALIAGFFIYIALGEIWSIITIIRKRAKKGVPKIKEIK